MASIIIFENGADQVSVNKAVTTALGSSVAKVMLIGSIGANHNDSRFQMILQNGDSMVPSMQQALSGNSDNQLLCLDARVSVRREELEQALREMEQQSSASMMCAPIALVDGTVVLPDLEPDSIVAEIGAQNAWPLAMVAVKRTAIEEYLIQTSGSVITNSLQMLAGMLTLATCRNEDVQMMARPVLHANHMTDAEWTLSDSQIVQVLRLALAACNIEDLFPNHPWRTHENESAAACYHSMAALFIRFGEHDAALECLKLSDQLEDSPRSLALKGIIALNRGETLGAVANLVSSLQQYEIRKKTDVKHYLNFQPENLEQINTSLHAGLAALNKRNNEQALACFAEAVFSFDSFYQDFGVSRMPGKGLAQ